MAKGKKGKKGKKEKKVDPNALTEVDKTFYELTITDLNRKLARLRSLTAELEEKNEQLQTDLSKLDEDRNDIIIYLKRILQERSDEIAELQERLKALEETRKDETEHYEEKITALQNEYKQMHEQLTSEIKLLEGKLNSLEEFRIQRDELMKKFEDQENQMEEQEKRHKNELYEVERKFIIGKDKLKKDMEARLLQLSSEFQEATELRIAATTHRVIRENIAINNELDAMLITHDKLHNDNEDMKARDKTLRMETELHEEEKKKALAKVRVQMKIIERLTKEHDDMVGRIEKYQTIEQEMHDANVELQNAKQTIVCLNHQIRILEQSLHATRCKETAMTTDFNNVQDDNDRLTDILTEAVLAIKEVLEVKSKIADEALRASKRESLLTQLFVLLSEAEQKKTRKPSLETIGSLSATYERGDLGFVPKPAVQRPTIPTVRHIEAQTGQSFEEFLAITYSEDVLQRQEGSLLYSVESSQLSEAVEVEEQSDVFFDEEEEMMEDSIIDFEDYDEDEEVPRKSVRPSGPEVRESRTKVSGKESRSATAMKDSRAPKSSKVSVERAATSEEVADDETTAETSPLPEDTKSGASPDGEEGKTGSKDDQV